MVCAGGGGDRNMEKRAIEELCRREMALWDRKRCIGNRLRFVDVDPRDVVMGEWIC